MTTISTYYSESSNFKARAEVVRDTLSDGTTQYKMVVYDQDGNYVTEEAFPGKSLRWAEDAAENWAMGIKVLNG